MTDKESATTRRRFLALGTLGASGALAGCIEAGRRTVAGVPAGSQESPTETATGAPGEATIRLRQRPDRLVYWVLPGQRRLSEAVFGTPDSPKELVAPVVRKAKSPAMKRLLREFPIPVGIPLKARGTADGRFTTTTIPTPFSDSGEVVDGQFDLTLRDRQPRDAGNPAQTDDEIELTASFTDPQDNQYEIRILTPFAPPVPDYSTGGGVRTDFEHHGNTGTGTPLMPQVYSPGAFWALGNVVANGEVVAERKVVHFMETQIVRTQNYRLAIQEELPLRPSETIAGQLHHMHAIVLPVTITEQGEPTFQPVGMPFTLPNGEKQPFVHVMYEQDEIVDASFEVQLPEPEATPTPTATATPAEGAVTVRGREYAFDPERVVVQQGQEVTVTFRNVGAIAHNFVIGALGVRTPTIQPGTSASVTFTPEEPDIYGFWCSVPGHQDEGMQGRLVVQE